MHLVSRELRATPVDASADAGAGALTCEALDLADSASAGRLAELVGASTAVVYAVGALYPAETEGRPWRDLYTSLPPFLTTLEAMTRRPGARLVFLSSGGTVYGDAGPRPLPESTPRSPLSSYGISKLAAEQYLSEHRLRVGNPATSLRVGNAYGPGQRVERGQGAVAAFLAAARDGATVPFYGSGDVTRDYVHVDDVAQAVSAVVDLAEPPLAINVGTGVGTSLTELHRMVEQVTGRPVRRALLPARPVDLPVNVLDVTLARDLWGWDPRDLATGLRDTWLDEGTRDEVPGHDLG